jgi:hypothetical protein
VCGRVGYLIFELTDTTLIYWSSQKGAVSLMQFLSVLRRWESCDVD